LLGYQSQYLVQFPFILANLDFSISDAFFESMSGITTTGSTVIANLDRITKKYTYVESYNAMARWRWDNCDGNNCLAFA
jgi:Trk-type K+ transport system membrane component